MHGSKGAAAGRCWRRPVTWIGASAWPSCWPTRQGTGSRRSGCYAGRTWTSTPAVSGGGETWTRSASSTTRPQGEEAAGLEYVHGLGWHGLRRKFPTELKAVPLPDLQHLGGWKTHRTILDCYQQPDEATMRQGLESRTPVRSGRPAAET